MRGQERRFVVAGAVHGRQPGQVIKLVGRCPEAHCRTRVHLTFDDSSPTWVPMPESCPYAFRPGSSGWDPDRGMVEPCVSPGTWLDPQMGYAGQCVEHHLSLDFSVEVPASERKARTPRPKVVKPAPESLPRIIRFDSRSDAGEYGNDSCAHCGALGRYQFHFLCEDGTHRAAMAGCIKLFRVSPVAEIHAGLLAKQADRAKLDRSLASWDTTTLAAIEAFYAGTMSEAECLAVARQQKAKAAAWASRRYARR